MNIFDYTDYRKFLHDYHQARKAVDRHCTVRYIAQEVGFRSASFFCQVTRGTSNLSDELIGKFAGFLELDAQQRAYFTTLVHYNQARNHENKKKFFRLLSSFRQSRLHQIDARLYEFYDKWYYNAIRELLYLRPFTGDYRELAHQLIPAITPAQARQAIRKLQKWELIRDNGQGGWIRSDTRNLTSGTDAQSFYINNYQLAVLDLAKKAIDLFARDERSFSTLTMSLSPQGYARIEAEVHRFRQAVLGIANEDSGEDRIYQMNIQLFPTSQSTRGADHEA